MPNKSIVSPDDQSVTFVELFFDLVFVFSITQIVGILHDGVTTVSVAQAVLVFWLVWWAWTQFTWALNAANTDHNSIQILTLGATAVSFFMAVSVPAVFEENALWFAGPYVLVRVIGLLVYVWVASADRKRLRAVRTFGTLSISGLVSVLAGAAAGGEALYWLWGLAIMLDVLAALVSVRGDERGEGFNLHSGHFVERHGLIVIIALGESLIVAAGGLVAAPKDMTIVVIGGLAVALVCALWWSYFPYTKPALEKALEEPTGPKQSALARDVFSLAHFPMLCGIIGIAAAIEAAIAHPDASMEIGGRAALAGGLALFIGGAAIAKWRALGIIPVVRVGLVALTVVLILALSVIPSFATLTVALCGTALITIVEHRQHARGSLDSLVSS